MKSVRYQVWRQPLAETRDRTREQVECPVWYHIAGRVNDVVADMAVDQIMSLVWDQVWAVAEQRTP